MSEGMRETNALMQWHEWMHGWHVWVQDFMELMDQLLDAWMHAVYEWMIGMPWNDMN